MRYFLVALLCLLVFAQDGECKGQVRSHEEVKIASKAVDMAMSRNGNYTYVLSEDGVLHIYKKGWVEIASMNIGAAVTKITASDRDDELFTIDKGGKLKILKISFPRDIDTSNSPIKGSPKAPIEIIVFSDFECPYCSNLAKILDKVLVRFPDKVKIIFKHCPLGYHKNAVEAAQAAIAAGIQGKFWEYHDLLFEHQKELSPQKLQELAEALGLNMEKFNKDRSSPEVTAIISRDVSQARALEIRGVPAVYINGVFQENTQEEALIKELESKLGSPQKN